MTVHRQFLTLICSFGVMGLLFSNLCEAKKSKMRPPSTLGAGDEIFLSISSHKALNRKHQINTLGEIALPFAGRIRLTGLTPEAAARHIARELSSHYRGLSQVQVVVLKYQKFVWLRGWVNKPGRYTLQWQESIGELLSRGGGVKPGAKLDSIWLHTPGLPPRKFNLKKFYRGGKLLQTPVLARNTVVFVSLSRSSSAQSGKIVSYLQPKSNTIAIFGAVAQPGIFPCYWKLNLLQALTLAKGTRQPSALQEIFIVTPNKPTQWFDLKAYFQKQNKNKLPWITPGSVIFVPTVPIGVSKRGPIHVFGRVGRPGTIRGTKMKDFNDLLASVGGPLPDANLQSVRVLYRGSNFTISQEVDIKRAFAQGRLDRLPPTPKGPLIVHIPGKRTPNVALAESMSVVQLIVGITSVVTSTILFVLTLQNQAAASNANNQTSRP